MPTVTALKEQLDLIKGRHASLLDEIKDINNIVDLQEHKMEVGEKARAVLNEAGLKVQEVFKHKVENLMTLAIRSVFDRPYDFKLIFEKKRNTVECRPVIFLEENELDPKEDMGGSIIDIISFVFRVVLWSLDRPRKRNVFVLDEPMRFVEKGDNIERAGQMLKHISKELGFQIIMVTHEPELVKIGDRIWKVSHDGVKSTVNLITDNPIKTRKSIRRKKNETSNTTT